MAALNNVDDFANIIRENFSDSFAIGYMKMMIVEKFSDAEIEHAIEHVKRIRNEMDEVN